MKYPLPFICLQQYTEKNMQTCSRARFRLTPHTPHCESDIVYNTEKGNCTLSLFLWLDACPFFYFFLRPVLLCLTMALGNWNIAEAVGQQ
jgi:hypothetical protein